MLSKWRHYVWCISLLLLVATVVLWVRSYWVADGLMRQFGGWTVFTGASRGTLYEFRTGPLPNGQPASLALGYQRQPAYPVIRRRAWPGEPGVRHEGGALGFAWFVTDGGTSNSVKVPGPPLPPGISIGAVTFALARQFCVPYWSLAILFALPPVACLATSHHRRRQRLLQQERRCRKCGYDLRATPDRCPECGTSTSGIRQPE